MKKLVPWIIVAGLVLFLGGTCARLQGVQRDRDIAAANYEAALDTTRRHLVGENESLSQLVEQREFEAEDIAGILGVTRDSIGALLAAIEDREVDHLAAVQGLEFRLESVTTENASLNADIIALSRTGEGFRVVAVDIESDHIRGDVDLSIPVDTTQAVDVEFVRLTVDPFTAVYTVGCSENLAVVAAQAPPWVNMDLEGGTVDPDVCNPPAPGGGFGSIFSFSPSNVTWAVAGAALGFLIGR